MIRERLLEHASAMEAYQKGGEVLENPYLPPSLLSYRTAVELVKPRLDADRYCIRRLRDQQSSFSKMSGEQISAAFPSLTPKDVDFLIKRFDRNSG